MTRLPVSGSDEGTWGDILNDYLRKAHKADGTLEDGSVTSNTIASGAVTKTTVGLGNVDNTSDTNKPVSAAAQTALNAKADSSALAAKLNTTDLDSQTASNITTNGTATQGALTSSFSSLVPAASTSAQGVVQLATTSQVVAGTDTVLAATSAGIAASLLSAKYANRGMHSINEFGGFAAASSPATGIESAFALAMSTLTVGQALFFPFDPGLVDSSGFCTYWIGAPLEWTKEIPIIAESKQVQVKLISGSGWGTTYCHAIRNWKHSDYSGATPTEVVDQAPDNDTPGTIHHHLLSLDGIGFRVNLNAQSNVSAVSLVHLHEMSRISLVATTGTSISTGYVWGCRALSLFSNTGNITAGPIYLDHITAYGYGWDHFLYADGTNGGTCSDWIQDVRIRDWCTMPQYTGNLVFFRHCIKSPFKLNAVNGIQFSGGHTEAVPSTSPPAIGSGAWPGASATVALGTRLIVTSTSGANQGLASIWSCRTAGTTGASEPAWPTPNSLSSPSNTVTDGSVVWQPNGYSTSLQGNGLGGILDGMLAWPGAGIAVPKGTTISPDGSHGWVCTTAGTTSGSQPAFSTASGRGSTQTDGSAVWTYHIDSFDSAQFRFIDVSHAQFISNRTACAGFGTNRPMIRATVTGTAPAQFYVFPALDIYSMQVLLGSIGVTGLTNAPKDGYLGKIIDTPQISLPFSYGSFDPRHIDRLTQWDVEFLHTKTLTPTRVNINGTVTAPSAAIPPNIILSGNYTPARDGTVHDVTTATTPTLAAGTYRVEAFLPYEGTTTSDAKFNLAAGTASVTGDLTWHHIATSASVASNSINVSKVAFATSQSTGAIGAGTVLALAMSGTIVVSSAGTVKLQFGQSTTDAAGDAILYSSANVVFTQLA